MTMMERKTEPVAVLISDIHYNINTLPIADAALRQAVAASVQLGVPLVIAGDLLDTKAMLRGECVKAIMETLKVGPTRRIVIPGNHCLINNHSKEHSLEFLRDRCEIIDSPVYDEELQSYLIPYQHDTTYLESLVESLEPGNRLIMHQGVLGADMGHYVQDKTSLPKEVFANQRVISGHYHRAQDIECGRLRRDAVGLFSYIGNPYTLSFGEANDGPKGFQILFDDGLLGQVPTNLRQHRVWEVNAETIPRCEKPGPADPLWIKYSGTHSELSKLKKKDLVKYVGHENFKLDKIYTDAEVSPATSVELTEAQILDKLIDDINDTPEEKKALKDLWREVLE